DRWDGLLGRKRGGTASVTDTGGTAFSSGMYEIGSHIPGNDETARELWGTDGTGRVKRMAGGTWFAEVTPDAAISGSFSHVVGCSLNGKRFLAYDSAVDRLHVWDPGLGSPRVRRVGMSPGSSAPTVANTGAGAYPATIRYYRVRFYLMTTPGIQSYSEPSAV